MSYEIYYDRAFIRVNDLYIPLVNQGSNNCWEINYFSRRQIPEKNWQVLNWQDRSRLLYTKDEVREIAKDLETISQESGTCFKSRNRHFEPGEFERWILCGLKSAFTVEEYVAARNKPEIHDYSDNKIENWKTYPFSTTQELLDMIESLKRCPMLNLHFKNNREVYRPVRSSIDRDKTEYYVLSSKAAGGGDLFFCKLTRRGYRMSTNLSRDDVRAFESEREAQKYLDKYSSRFYGNNFKPKRISNILQSS